MHKPWLIPSKEQIHYPSEEKIWAVRILGFPLALLCVLTFWAPPTWLFGTAYMGWYLGYMKEDSLRHDLYDRDRDKIRHYRMYESLRPLADELERRWEA